MVGQVSACLAEKTETPTGVRHRWLTSHAGTFYSMLNWDFVKAAPVTYQAIDGAICFEVTVERENCKDAVTVTRTEGDKFAIKVFRDHRKALRWCEKHPLSAR
jgi:hypothetical protein